MVRAVERQIKPKKQPARRVRGQIVLPAVIGRRVDAWARSVGLLNPDGTVRRSEATRCIMVLGMLSSARVSAAEIVEYCVVNNRTMIVATFGRRVTMAASVKGTADDGQVSSAGGHFIRFRLSDWMKEQMERICVANPKYRGPGDMFLDSRLAADLVVLGLGNPASKEVGLRYAQRIRPIHAAFRELEQRVLAVMKQVFEARSPASTAARLAVGGQVA